MILQTIVGEPMTEGLPEKGICNILRFGSRE